MNFLDSPLETIFFFPADVQAILTKLEIEFTLQDGTKQYMETKVGGRRKVYNQYDDMVASGHTVVMGGYSEQMRDMVRILIGNFPPNSEAQLKLFFYQKLEVEDLSYCLKIPMVYIPRYITRLTKVTNQSYNLLHPDMNETNFIPDEEETKSYELPNSIPSTNKIDYAWSLSINIMTLGMISRVSCRTHTTDIFYE